MRALPFLAQTVVLLRRCCFYHGVLHATGHSSLDTDGRAWGGRDQLIDSQMPCFQKGDFLRR